MASNYPGSLDSFDTIASDKKTSDAVGGRTHRQMHNDLGDAIESVQTELGTNPSGSDATVAARLSAIEAGTNLATGAVTSAKIADGAVTAAKLGSDVRIGNLLTANQASVATTGLFTLNGCTEGAAGVLTAASGSAFEAYLPTVAVAAGDTVTAVATLAMVGRTGRIIVQFQTAAGASLGEDSLGSVVTAGSTGESRLTAVAPATTAKARIYVVYTGSGSGGDTATVTKIGIWKAAGGTWQMPGTPIVHTGIRPNPSNTAEVQIWNDATATWITV